MRRVPRAEVGVDHYTAVRIAIARFSFGCGLAAGEFSLGESMIHKSLNFCAITLISSLVLISGAARGDTTTASPRPPTVQEAERFIKQAEARLEKLSIKSSRADWVQST